ncbi:MAG: hypothetical protein LBP41_02380 [Holosporaceae bacterium]|nr:hypothetical protein [Holosporaceae bacterium]
MGEPAVVDVYGVDKGNHVIFIKQLKTGQKVEEIVNFLSRKDSIIKRLLRCFSLCCSAEHISNSGIRCYFGSDGYSGIKIQLRADSGYHGCSEPLLMLGGIPLESMLYTLDCMSKYFHGLTISSIALLSLNDIYDVRLFFSGNKPLI